VEVDLQGGDCREALLGPATDWWEEGGGKGVQGGILVYILLDAEASLGRAPL
jgi:hypothetical protein